MKYAEFVKAGEMKIVDREKPAIEKSDDVIIKVIRTCVCGSDLWAYRGIENQGSDNDGHEIIGIVEEVGKDITTVKPGDSVIVLGDGAVGQCAIIAAKLRGAKQIISTSRHADRAALAKEFGATDNVAERDEEGINKLLELTNGGADAVLECVGTELSNEEAVKVARPGANIGRVGLPHGKAQDPATTFYKNAIVGGGPASVTTYDKEVLLKAVLDGKINPGKVFTKTFSLDQINEAYQEMVDRKVIKSYVKVSD